MSKFVLQLSEKIEHFHDAEQLRPRRIPEQRALSHPAGHGLRRFLPPDERDAGRRASREDSPVVVPGLHIRQPGKLGRHLRSVLGRK